MAELPSELRPWLRTRGLIAAGAIALLLVLPALWNGYPLVFSDTAVYLGYIRSPTNPPFYTLWVVASSLHASLELTVLAQALLVTVTVLVCLRCLAGEARTGRLALGALAASALGQLPWLTSWIMPDFLAGLGIFALIALILGRDAPGPWRRWVLAAVALFGALAATANPPVFAATLALALALKALLLKQSIATRNSALAVAAVALGFVGIIGFNAAIHGKAVMNPGSPVMTFSRLADTGLAQRQLPRLCAEKNYAICGHLPELGRRQRGHQDFLWSELPAETEGWTVNAGQYAELSRRIIAADPGAFIGEGLQDAAKLAAAPTMTARGAAEPGDAALSSLPPHDWTVRLIDLWYPASAARFQAGRQQRAEIQRDPSIMTFPLAFYRATAFAGYFVLAASMALAARRGDRVFLAIGLALFAGVAAEIVLNAMLVGPFPRYHAKVSWVPWFVVAAWLISELRQRRERGASPGRTAASVAAPS